MLWYLHCHWSAQPLGSTSSVSLLEGISAALRNQRLSSRREVLWKSSKGLCRAQLQSLFLSLPPFLYHTFYCISSLSLCFDNTIFWCLLCFPVQKESRAILSASLMLSLQPHQLSVARALDTSHQGVTLDSRGGARSLKQSNAQHLSRGCSCGYLSKGEPRRGATNCLKFLSGTFL